MTKVFVIVNEILRQLILPAGKPIFNRVNSQLHRGLSRREESRSALTNAQSAARPIHPKRDLRATVRRILRSSRASDAQLVQARPSPSGEWTASPERVGGAKEDACRHRRLRH